MVWTLTTELDLSRVETIDSKRTLGRRSVFVDALATVQAVSIGAQPAHAAQNCGSGGIGFRQDQHLALAIASKTTSTSTSMITTCVPLVITSQGTVTA